MSQTGLPHWREATGEDEGGRGFQLVNEITQRWGSSASEAAPVSGSSSSPGIAGPPAAGHTFM